MQFNYTELMAAGFDFATHIHTTHSAQTQEPEKKEGIPVTL